MLWEEPQHSSEKASVRPVASPEQERSSLVGEVPTGQEWSASAQGLTGVPGSSVAPCDAVVVFLQVLQVEKVS